MEKRQLNIDVEARAARAREAFEQGTTARKPLLLLMPMYWGRMPMCWHRWCNPSVVVWVDFAKCVVQ